MTVAAPPPKPITFAAASAHIDKRTNLVSSRIVCYAKPKHIKNALCQEGHMPKGPQGQKRPADVIGCAVMVAEIATGKTGAEARATKLTQEERSAIAIKAAARRWG
jgi:hypothetical protein